MKWIKSTESLPEEGQFVLFTFMYKGFRSYYAAPFFRAFYLIEDNLKFGPEIIDAWTPIEYEGVTQFYNQLKIKKN